jgi:Phage integrase family
MLGFGGGAAGCGRGASVALGSDPCGDTVLPRSATCRTEALSRVTRPSLSTETRTTPASGEITGTPFITCRNWTIVSVTRSGSKRPEPSDVPPAAEAKLARYIETLQASAANPTVKQHLAAVRMPWSPSGSRTITRSASAGGSACTRKAASAMKCRRTTLWKPIWMPISMLPASGGMGKRPLFRSAVGRTGTFTATAMNRIDAWRMVKRRAEALGMKIRIGCHTFRATGITAYLEAGGTLENVQAMAAHESPRTTKLYDRTGDEITLDEVERITI